MSTDEYVPRAVTWDEIETGFHEYAADLTKREMEVNGPGDTSYPPEFADWKVGMAAAQKWLAVHDARVRRDAAKEMSALPKRFRDPEALARFIIENEWALDSEINPSGRADWLETLNRVHDNWDERTPDDFVSAIAAAIRLDRDFRTPFQHEVARAALTDLAESSLRTADLAAARGDGEWEADARFVAREAIAHRDAHYPIPEETP